MKRSVWLAVLAVIWAAGRPALAEIAHPVRQGVMCLSATALAILTLPNGDSRTHQASQRMGDRQIAEEGGCVDLQPDMALSVYRSYHNTSLVFTILQDGGRSPMYRVPNIDLQMSAAPATEAGQSAAPPPGASNSPGGEQPRIGDVGDYVVKQRFKVGQDGAFIELLQDRRLSPQVFSDLWRSGRSGRRDARAAGLLTGGPLLAARLRLTGPGNTPGQTRDIGYPLATLSPLDDSGETFSLHVDTTNRQASRIVEEKLFPAAHGLTPPAQRASNQAQHGTDDGAAAGAPLLAHYETSPERR